MEFLGYLTRGLIGGGTTREQIITSYEEDDELVLLVVGDEVVGVVYAPVREQQDVEVACN